MITRKVEPFIAFKKWLDYQGIKYDFCFNRKYFKKTCKFNIIAIDNRMLSNIESMIHEFKSVSYDYKDDGSIEIIVTIKTKIRMKTFKY